jgi:uncharacterized membrane protein
MNLLLCAVSYTLLQATILRLHGRDSLLARALGRDFKGKVSPVLYVVGVAVAWLGSPPAGIAFFIAVALIWLVPDRRIERVIVSQSE